MPAPVTAHDWGRGSACAAPAGRLPPRAAARRGRPALQPVPAARRMPACARRHTPVGVCGGLALRGVHGGLALRGVRAALAGSKGCVVSPEGLGGLVGRVLGQRLRSMAKTAAWGLFLETSRPTFPLRRPGELAPRGLQRHSPGAPSAATGLLYSPRGVRTPCSVASWHVPGRASRGPNVLAAE